MAGLTRAQIRTSAKRRANMENSSFVSDAEWNDYADESASELFDLLLATDEKAYQSSATINVVSGTQQYALPSTFYKVMGVFIIELGQRILSLERFTAHDLGYEGGVYGIHNLAQSGRPYAYEVIGSNIWFYPKPSGNHTVELLFVPQYTRFTSDAATLPYPVVNGWEEFVSLGMAIKARIKEESDVSALQLQKQMCADRIRRMALRDNFNSRVIRDRYGVSTRFRRYPGRYAGWR